MSRVTAHEFEQTLAEISRRSTLDPDFRTLALTNARAAYKMVSGKEMPENLSIVFADNSGDVKTVPLPDPLTGITDTDIEAELANVAGGTWSAGSAFSSGPKPTQPPATS